MNVQDILFNHKILFFKYFFHANLFFSYGQEIKTKKQRKKQNTFPHEYNQKLTRVT